MEASKIDPSASGLSELRGLVPACERFTYLNTAAGSPGVGPVADAVHAAVADWTAGDFVWAAWEGAAEATRRLFASRLRASPDTVSLAPSLAAAASTIAQSLPVGRVVVGGHEWRSNLFPWLALSARGFDLEVVSPLDGVVSTAALIDAVDERTTLLAVSETQSATGYRVDIPSICEACHAVGARVFVDLSQSLGAIRFDVNDGRPEYVAAHGYKWLLSPRGAAWLYVAPELIGETQPLAPSWKSSPDTMQMYGPPLAYADTAARLDTSLAWFSWVGAQAALELLESLDESEVEARCLGLAADFRARAQGLGFEVVNEELPSHIQALRVGPDPDRLAEVLKRARVIASVRAGLLRVGFHAFNNESDVAAAVTALEGLRKLEN